MMKLFPQHKHCNRYKQFGKRYNLNNEEQELKQKKTCITSMKAKFKGQKGRADRAEDPGEDQKEYQVWKSGKK